MGRLLGSLLAPLQVWLRSWHAPVPLGRRGEQAAARYLRRLGYKIVARGSRGHIGELDLVAVDGRTVVFVEVKTRSSLDAGHPAAAVDNRKQQQLLRVAHAYVRRHELEQVGTRFDVVAVVWPPGERKPRIEHIQDAFRPLIIGTRSE